MLLPGIVAGAAEDLRPAVLTRTTVRAYFQMAADQQAKTAAILKIVQADTVLPAAVRTVYIGALQVLKARDAFFPFTKLKWLKKGMKTLDQARKLDPTNLEVIFVQGVVCFRLPKILGYRDDGHRHFSDLIELLPEQWSHYDREFIQQMLDVVHREINPSGRQRQILTNIKNHLMGKSE